MKSGKKGEGVVHGMEIEYGVCAREAAQYWVETNGEEIEQNNEPAIKPAVKRAKQQASDQASDQARKTTSQRSTAKREKNKKNKQKKKKENENETWGSIWSGWGVMSGETHMTCAVE
jgi:hypothetical protein